eukprot:3963475-Prymnesium_polylepis.1
MSKAKSPSEVVSPSPAAMATSPDAMLPIFPPQDDPVTVPWMLRFPTIREAASTRPSSCSQSTLRDAASTR